MNKNIEFFVRDYYAQNLNLIDEQLILEETEHEFPGGRIDIYTKNRKTGRPVAIEIKALKYNTKTTAMQLLNYINYVKDRNGKVYFVSPKVNQGLLNILREYYLNRTLHFFEYTIHKQEFITTKVYENDLEDTRNIKYADELLKDKSILKTQAIRKVASAGIDIILKTGLEGAHYKIIRGFVKRMTGY